MGCFPGGLPDALGLGGATLGPVPLMLILSASTGLVLRALSFFAIVPPLLDEASHLSKLAKLAP